MNDLPDLYLVEFFCQPSVYNGIDVHYTLTEVKQNVHDCG